MMCCGRKIHYPWCFDLKLIVEFVQISNSNVLVCQHFKLDVEAPTKGKWYNYGRLICYYANLCPFYTIYFSDFWNRVFKKVVPREKKNEALKIYTFEKVRFSNHWSKHALIFKNFFMWSTCEVKVVFLKVQLYASQDYNNF